MNDTFEFSRDFQDLCLATILRHSKELGYALTCLQPIYFGGVEATLVAKAALDFHKKYNQMPTFPVLEEVATDACNGITDGESITTYIRRLAEFDTKNWDYVASKIVDFARAQAALHALRKCIDLLKDPEHPPGWEYGLPGIMEKALQVGRNLEDIGLSLHQDFDSTIRKIVSEDYGISTGYRALDDIWKMGWKPGWLVVPLAPPKRYKTTMALNLALRMSQKCGYDVLYYTLEISKEDVIFRAASYLARQEQSVAYEDVESFIAAARKEIDQGLNHFFVQSFSSKQGSIADIRQHAKMMINEHGFRPRMIVIDYAETVRPVERSKYDKEYQRQAGIYTDARALGQELGCVILMPDRCNRENASKDVPDAAAFQGSFEKAGIVDVAFGLCATEKEMVSGDIRLFVFLNRHGPAYMTVKGKVNAPLWTIDLDDEWNPYEPSTPAPLIQMPKPPEGRRVATA